MIEILNNSETLFSLLVKGNALQEFFFFLEQSECSRSQSSQYLTTQSCTKVGLDQELLCVPNASQCLCTWPKLQETYIFTKKSQGIGWKTTGYIR